jgi:CHAT domain-containing protein
MIYARINLANSLLRYQALAAAGKSTERPSSESSNRIAQLLVTATRQAHTLQDVRAESYGIGTLGQIYEQTQQWQEAQKLTRQAIRLASGSPEIAYLWQWQLGRLLKAQGQTQPAIVAYQEAVKLVNSVRQELVLTAFEEQFSFRNTVEPIHRELVDLLLTVDGERDVNQRLSSARGMIESLQLSELVNFFRQDCLPAKANLDQLDPASAVFYPILLPNRLAVIVSFADQTFTAFATSLHTEATSDEIKVMATRLRNALQQDNIPESEFLPAAQHLYTWLIRPIESELKTRQIQTLVFVLDGALRNVPMSVLHDGERFLIEQYSVALSPGLQLLPPQPRQQSPTALLAGLTEARSGFPPLPNITTEIQSIQTQVPNNQQLVDQKFTNHNLQQYLQSTPAIVHLATHGQFSSNLEDTFILTWDDRLNIEQVKTLLESTTLRQPSAIDLLVLSACETAVGDSRAALGLAGIAVRSGARSTLATLWQVNDEATARLMGHFYQHLMRSGITKAEALRRAQLKLLKSTENIRDRAPYYWAPYVLIGNWQ